MSASCGCCCRFVLQWLTTPPPWQFLHTEKTTSLVFYFFFLKHLLNFGSNNALRPHSDRLQQPELSPQRASEVGGGGSCCATVVSAERFASS